MLSIELIIALVIIFIIAFVLTYYFMRRMENQMKSYEEEGTTFEDERERSLRYETESFRKHLPIQVVLYIIIFIVSAVGIVFYII